MQCQSLQECFEQISAYVDGEMTGYPLLVNTENFLDYRQIMERLSADETKRCVYVSDYTADDGIPNIQTVFEVIRKPGNFAVFGISQSLMLQGETALDERIDDLLNFTVKGHTIVLFSHCRGYLEKYLQRDVRKKRKLLFLAGEKSRLPQIRIAKSPQECIGSYDNGMKALVSHLEQLSDEDVMRHPTILVMTRFSASLFQNSMYTVTTSDGVYETLVQKDADLSHATQKTFGTDEQWSWLFERIDEESAFSTVIAVRFGGASGLAERIADVYDTDDEKEKWLLWLAMKVFGTPENGYLSFVLAQTDHYGSLLHHIYRDLLDVAADDERFESFYQERRRLISQLPENLPEIKAYCDNVGRHGKNAVFYLTDATEDERYAFMEQVDKNAWTDEELRKAVKHGFPELALYLNDFVFDSVNTKLPEKDASFRQILTDYFRRYKIQKIKNHIEETFLEEVDRFAMERPFYKLRPRSSVVLNMEKTETQAYFFDALGVEYLSYIQAKCEEYGMVYDISIAHCELPSVTSKNKEFRQRFTTKDIRSLDELKHHSQIYDYETCKYPVYIFEELKIIDQELRRIRSWLVQNNCKKAVVLSDHGASRLAVIHRHESTAQLLLDEKGQHSGRCCPCNEDPGIVQAVYEDGYVILANYDRFKGSRKANLEVHGGASLEEVVVPIIVLSLRPSNVVYYFVNPVVKLKVGQTPRIELFCNMPMKQPRIEIEGEFYEGEFTVDKNHAVFELKNQKRVRDYKATVYEGGVNTGNVLVFRIERGTKTRDLFGMK